LNKNKIYFASDFHLGYPNLEESHNRERLIISWLNTIQEDAESIYLLGDIFDFWFEYKEAVPKGFVRILGKLSQLTDNKINIYFIAGNHDMWIKDYLSKEVGLKIIDNNTIIKEQNIKLFISHGDGLENGDFSYKILKMIFSSQVCRWGFSLIHPNIGIKIAHLWSKKSRQKNKNNNYIKDHDLLIQYCQKQQKLNPVDYYVVGHKHMPVEKALDENTKYICLGDLISHNTYAVLEDGIISLKEYEEKKPLSS
jgi:UDP-2,3-diacylglucosamine hydrolase